MQAAPDSLAHLDFAKAGGLLPAVIQDVHTRQVLMVGFMNEAALAKTLAEGVVTFYSRTKQRLWTKGETSGHFLRVHQVIPDCDQDTLLIKAEPLGPVCHTGADTCFDETNQGREYFLGYLQQVIRQRKGQAPETSYTAKLLGRGINKVAQKVGEEAVELVIEAKDDNRELFKNEAADLLFHYLLLLEAKAVPLDEVIAVLQARHK
ncbi:MAG: bifunctional phosphoribosyl-AMP cyclohydrolase/phosphoribosyl-ATP diphosphatase HisIE [Bernardetiaceae bacterium]|jgi:phosphoribosyl-ATP pyrophosphohydrolase/phosphoribosyl-AMP cyclohydrolase|nr:bifunctional phosphoribosyl-AMP cyclohydrolase/phosphoribosyl-ATP diphosphatase HisIE [Bernardetiaceae bacterium]